jgi:hypothetical protein
MQFEAIFLLSAVEAVEVPTPELFALRMINGRCGGCNSKYWVVEVPSEYWESCGMVLRICEPCLPHLDDLLSRYVRCGINVEKAPVVRLTRSDDIRITFDDHETSM